MNETPSQIQRTELSELGEFGLIRHLTKNIKLKHVSSVKGVGDDAAVIDSGDKLMVVTTDLIVEGVHFDLTYCPLKHLGYKAAVVNFSDVYAMNADPRQMTVSIAVSNRFPLEAMEELYTGIYRACDHYDVDVVGGDTSSSLTGLLISITAIGEVKKEDVVYRSTANEDDLICVTGSLGAAYVGLQLLEREKFVFKDNPEMQPDLQGHDHILERLLKPEAPKETIRWLKKNGILPTSMIDISDGLASELIHICNSSDKGCSVYEEKIPIDDITRKEAKELNIEPLICALNGGEDYELLFTIKQPDYEKLKDYTGITTIGHITHKSSGMNLITASGSQIPLTAQGWDAFLKSQAPRGKGKG